MVWIVIKEQHSVQVALAAIHGDDRKFQGWEGSVDEDAEDPDCIPNNKDMENDESSESGDSDWSQSGYLWLEPLNQR